MAMESEATKILKDKNVPFRIIKLSNKGISSGDVAKYAVDRLNPSEICKTIITKDKSNNNYALLLKGDDKIDFSKIKNVVGQKISIVRYEDVKQSTGKEPGAVCPITLDMPIFVDDKIFQSEKINFGSGNHMFGIEVSSNDLKKIFVFQKVDIAQ